MKRKENLPKNKTQWKQLIYKRDTNQFNIKLVVITFTIGPVVAMSDYKFMLASQHILIRCFSSKITNLINNDGALTTNIIYFATS